jgi:hypothetical protein
MAYQPVVTTVIPTYRRPQFVRRAIHSALKQSFERVRVAVYDNASGDETSDGVGAIARRDGRVTYHRHDTNIGASANYNYGLARVTTPYFSLLADDDVLLPELYARAVEALEKDREIRFFCARTIIDNRRAGVLQHRGGWRRGLYSPSAGTAAHMVADHFINTAVVFRTSVLQSVGFFDDLGADRNYLVLAAAMHPFAVTDEELGVMTIHSRSFSGGGAPTDFGTGTTWSWGGSYVIASEQELIRRLDGMSWSASDLVMVTSVLRRQTRRDLLYIAATAPSAARFRAELQALHRLDGELGFSAPGRAALGMASVAARWPPFAWLLHAMATSTWRMSKRLHKTSARDEMLRTYLRSLDSSDNESGGT